MRIKNVRPKYQRRFTAVRWGLFMLMAFIFFIISGTGSFVKPVLLLPVAVCISINENEIISACTGAVCGLLTDILFDRVFGFNAILFVMFCVMTSLLFVHYLRRNIVNAVLVTAAAAFLHGLIDYILSYYIWNSADVSVIYTSTILPSCIMTTISAVLIYPAIRAIRFRFTPERFQYSIDL